MSHREASANPALSKPSSSHRNSGSIRFRQGVAAGFRWEGQDQQTDQEDGAHSHSGIAKGLGPRATAKYPPRQQTQSGRTQGGNKPRSVVTKGSSGAAQPRREQLGKINGVSSEQGELAKSHDRNHPEYVADSLKVPEDEGGAQHGQHKRNGEGRPASNVVSDEAKSKNSQAGADVEHHRSPSRPVVNVKGFVRSSHTLLLSTGFKNGTLEVDAEKSNGPEPDDAG